MCGKILRLQGPRARERNGMSADQNRPRGRERNVTGPGKTVHKRGDGLGTRPVGSAGGHSGGGQGSGGGTWGTGGRGGGVKLILLLLAVLLGGGGGLPPSWAGRVPLPRPRPRASSSPTRGERFPARTGPSCSAGWGAVACPPAGTIRPTPGGWTPPWRKGPGRSTPSCWETGGTPPPLWSICAAPTWSPGTAWAPPI